MSKQFRNCDLNQALLLPPSLQDWLPEGRLARFVAEVVETLDLAAIYGEYEKRDGLGLAAYDPRKMVRLLIYGYCRGVGSSRRIERATYEDLAFRYLAADEHPDHSGIAAFRKAHLEALSQLFVQVLRLCQRAGLVKLGHVALDGTKEKAEEEKARVEAQLKEREKQEQAQPEPKAQRNFTDPESRIMKDSATKEFVQGYNAQAAVEPVFGQIKERRGFRRFLLRGLDRVEAEWKIICATHNLLKLYRSGKATWN